MIWAQLCYISAILCKLFGARNLHFVILAFPVKKYNVILFQISKESGQPCELMEELKGTTDEFIESKVRGWV